MRRFIFQPPRPAKPVDLSTGVRLLELGESQAPVFVLHSPAAPNAPSMVYFHGNAMELADLVPLAVRVRDAGLGFIAIEYPGYGPASAQRVSEAAIYSASVRALDHLLEERVVAPDQTTLVGQSVGTGVAIEMATRGYGSRMVLVSPFSSMVEMMRHHARFLPARLLVRDRFDNLAKAKQVQIPVLVVHGADDNLVPAQMSESLAHSLPDAHRVLLPGRGHNDLGDAVVNATVIAATQPPEHWLTPAHWPGLSE